MKNSANLDLLRAMAVLSVLFGHLIHTTAYVFHLALPRPVSEMSHFGVVVFFVHTACVLMMSLERLSADGRGRVSLRFFIRRAFRIYPLSILCVLIVVLAHISRTPWQPHNVISNGKVVALNLALMHNVKGGAVLAPLWSLPYEIQMYVLLPGIFAVLVLGKRRWTVAAGMWLAALALALLPAKWLTTYFPCFMSGIVAYCLFRVTKKVVPSYVWPIFLVTLWIVICFIGNDYAWLDWIGSAALGAGIPFFAEIRNEPLRRASAVVAKYSYGIYLCHLPLMWLVFVRWSQLPFAVQWILFAAMVTTLPVVLFHAIEQPMIRAGAKLAESTT
jgi:peptidoglycan/LPS O-acetylase OafA/YrhL